MRYAIESMVTRDIREVLEVDRESYSLPWPASTYRRELQQNDQAHYIVLRELDTDGPGSVDPERGKSWRTLLSWRRTGTELQNASRGRIVGYAGMWLMLDEAHITTIAVRQLLRGHGLGELLLATLIEKAQALGSRTVTLEVRVSNSVAQSLYHKYGFHEAGVRRRYYSDNNEDAYIMTTDDITLAAYQVQFRALKDTLAGRLYDVESIETLGSAVPAASYGPPKA